MKKLELTITALSPLAIGAQKPGTSVSEVEKYIPGAVVRGAIASQILRLSDGNTEGHFQQLFLGDNPAIFHNAYPGIAKISKEKSQIANSSVKVIPATAMSSKTNPGFKPNGNEVFDTLIDCFFADACNLPYDPSDPNASKPGENPQVEAYRGFYSGCDKNYYIHDVSSRFLTRVGINRRRATSEEEILYSVEVLNESFLKNRETGEWDNFVYSGLITVENDSLADALSRFLNKGSQNFRIGGSASRGLGKVKFAAKESKSSIKKVKTRINNFNQALENRWNLWSVFVSKSNPLDNNRTYFTVNLHSDAILTENWQRTTVVSETMLQQFTQVEDSSLKLHVAYSSYDYGSGWNSAWGLMKDVELLTNKGAVYLFSTEHPEKWYKPLEKLEINGIGNRTCEGFGHIEICNEFHQVFRENAV
ncbi:MAG: CRISPR-associated RAMP protein Csx10 [Cyanobacteria bacterium J06633_8]